MTCSGTASGRHRWNYFSWPHVKCRECCKTRAEVAETEGLSLIELLDICIQSNKDVLKRKCNPMGEVKSLEYYEGALHALLIIKGKIK